MTMAAASAVAPRALYAEQGEAGEPATSPAVSAGVSTFEDVWRTVRDRFYPKAMLQLDEVKGLDDMMQDAIAFKYITQPLTPQQVSELLQHPGKRR